MTEEPNGRLHLPSLSIRGFRGIGELDVPRLGRVTLLAGKNGAGKTTVIEAIRVYASRGREYVLSELLGSREEFSSILDEDPDDIRSVPRLMPDTAALFYGRDASPGSCIEIGPGNGLGGESLKIEAVMPSGEQEDLLEKRYDYDGMASDAPPLAIEISFADVRRTIPWSWSFVRRIRSRRLADDQEELATGLNCRSLGPGLPDNDEVAELWDEVALTDEEDRAVQALNLVLDGKAARVTMIGNHHPGRRSYLGRRPYERRAVVKLEDQIAPVPLRSLGDGATRLFGVALALAGSRNGFLVIDEAENGIHHSVHDAFWRMVLRAAQENGVQVFATTHSLDCVQGFARAATASPECEGVLARLERRDEQTRAIVYSKSALETVAEQGIEVR